MPNRYLPEHISLGPATVKVEEVDEYINETEDTLQIGKWNGINHTISVYAGPDTSESSIRAVFYHEIMEGINDLYDLELNHSTLSVVANSFLQVHDTLTT